MHRCLQDDQAVRGGPSEVHGEGDGEAASVLHPGMKEEAFEGIEPGVVVSSEELSQGVYDPIPNDWNRHSGHGIGVIAQ